jgi:hypothetical protein
MTTQPPAVDDTRDHRTVAAVRVLADPAAWAAAAVALGLGLAVLAGTALWLQQQMMNSPLELLDGGTWARAGFAASIAWRLSLLATMSTGALWARGMQAGQRMTTGILLRRLLERVWILMKVATYWAAVASLLTRAGKRWPKLRWVVRLMRAATAASSVAAVVAIARREPPAKVSDANRLGRTLVGGRTTVAVQSLVSAVSVLPFIAAWLWASATVAETWQIVTLLALLPAVFCMVGLVTGARLWNVAAKRGAKRAKRRN